jgi:HSP20 family protein
MANISRRDDREVSRPPSPEYRWDPFRMLDALLRPALYSGDWAGQSTTEFIPRFDVKETKDGFVFKADLPGVKESDLEVSLNGGQLTISGAREEESRQEGERYYAIERSHGTFARTFSLPDSVDSDHVTAELKDGILTVTVPKKPESQPKKITLSKGGGGGGAKA